ncbi:OmpA family protein [Winogradskyella sp. SYSU M77433]|uniref:OmpA family protein n=1 Tax=Winogradskyella sp. SYSU M77433 TaxID=3042722 RepID=UPI002480E309|nr:OmpA family protein [Winogradskyella sp. SYSU M77433]MDH7911263.1 OmpA family protein [Winogradskyella sp. SYSU M77433]
MKPLKITIVLFFTCVFGLFAQNKDTKEADKYFTELEYLKAIKSYNKLVSSNKADVYVYSQLAEANFNIFNTKEAEKWYAKALETSQDANTMYKYAEMLKANGKYEQSEIWMQKFVEQNPKDERAKAYSENPDYVKSILEGEQLYKLTSLDFNSTESDFGGTQQDGVLYFASGRDTSGKKYRWDNESYLDIYQVVLGEGTEEDAQQVEGSINTKYHEGLVSFSPDGNTMYFSRESFFDGDYIKNKENRTKTSVIYLFKATKTNGKWDDVEPLPFNNKNYSVKNPAVSADGNTLFFVSNMPQSVGGYDIFKVAINKDGTFGEPMNLGDEINTVEHEMFPYVSSNNTLYFSSTGHLGLGGLDVFYVDENNKVQNIGVPVNSRSDDLAFTIDEETGKGFVSSNREGGKGNDDIYAIERIQPCRVEVTITVLDEETSKILSGVDIVIKNHLDKVVEKVTDNNGNVVYEVACDKALEIKASLQGYESVSTIFSGSKNEKETIQILLSPIEKIIKDEKVVLDPILFDFDKANITSQGAFELDKLVAVMKKYPKMEILAESHTDNIGSKKYNKQLSEQRVKSTVQYVISKGIDESRITGVGKGEEDPKVDCGSKCTDEDHQINRRTEFIIVKGNPLKE